MCEIRKKLKYLLAASMLLVSFAMFPQGKAITPPKPVSAAEKKQQRASTAAQRKSSTSSSHSSSKPATSSSASKPTSSNKPTTSKPSSSGSGSHTASTKPKPGNSGVSSKPSQPQHVFTGPVSGWVDDYEWVDLDLPSGTKWATCNVGADDPEDIGYYFGWRETSPFDPSGVLYGTISESERGDAASEYWSENWRIPTYEELSELKRCCRWKWTNRYGVYGAEITGRNGASIFLPASGTLLNDCYIDINSKGTYWSSTPDNQNPDREAYILVIDDRGLHYDWDYLYCGLTIRPVLND